MEILRIKDNSSKRKDECERIHNIISKIANKTLKQLENEGIFVFPEIIDDADDLNNKQFVLQSINDDYVTGNVMGFIGCSEERLIIESRFVENNIENNNDYLLQYLIKTVFDPNIVDLDTDANQDEKLFNYLLFLFPHYIKRAMRKGVYKVYARNEYSDKNVKGTIDFKRHIKLNVPFIGNIAYNHREFSYDNYMIQLIRHTIEYIKTKEYGHLVLTRIKDESKLIVEITQSYKVQDRNKIINTNIKNIVRHAYYKEYYNLQHLCLLILRHQMHQIGYGNKKIYGILFDGAWLWEEYIYTIIGKGFHHPRNKGKKSERYPQQLFYGCEREIGLIYPDYIGKDLNNRMIVDAKYKPVNNIGNKDYFQLLAYMFRFDSKKGYYIYPEKNDDEGDNGREFKMLEGHTFNNSVKEREKVVSVKKYGFQIPQNINDYSAFESEMHKNEEKLKKEFGIDEV